MKKLPVSGRDQFRFEVHRRRHLQKLRLHLEEVLIHRRRGFDRRQGLKVPIGCLSFLEQ